MRRLLDQFPVLLLDMGGTFVFDCDKFGADENFHETYRSAGGTRLSSSQVEGFIRSCFDGMMRDYNDPACFENFPTLMEAFQRYTDAPKEELPLLEEVFAIHEFGKVSEPIVSLLHRLARTHQLGLVSNIWSPKRLCLAEFQRAGLSGVFRHLVFSSDFRSIKPSPLLFHEILRGMNTQANNVLFVGDSLQRDMEAAKKIGMTTVWITSEPRPHPSVDVVLKKIEDIESC
jgi:HAD superfamily hydrolase (TIGR01509 family)